MEEIEFLVSSLEQTLGVVVAGGDVSAVTHHTAVYSLQLAGLNSQTQDLSQYLRLRPVWQRLPSLESGPAFFPGPHW